MFLYKILLNLTGHQLKFLYRVCLREADRIKSKFDEFPSLHRYELKTIDEIILQIQNEIVKIENELGVKI